MAVQNHIVIELHYTVCQKNLEYCFVVTLNLELNLSLGKHTTKYRKRKQEISLNHAKNNRTVSVKRRRLILKKKKMQKYVNGKP